MASNKFVFSVLALLTISSSEALRFLVFFPLFSRSHSILGQGVVSRLLEAGHEVVHITSIPRNNPGANLTEINVELSANSMAPNREEFKLKNLVGKSNIGDSIFFNFLVYNIHKSILEDPSFVNLLKDPKQTFDAVILEWFFANEIAGMAPLFECPLIWFGSTEAHWQVIKLVDEIPNPAYNVDLFATSRAPLNFWERMHQLYQMIKKMILIETLVTPYEKTIYNDLFVKIGSERGVKMPTYEEAVYNGSLLLINSHPSLGTPFRLPQNAKYIAGYHIDTDIKPLPKDLQKIMDEAKHGVIYFSMGSNLKSADMSEHMRNSLLNLFGKLNQAVIWKFENDLNETPKNVHLVKWAPQQSILSHPNLKFFITHGGQLSTTEAIHFGVPVIGIPVFADQFINMISVESKGFGVSVALAEDMATELSGAIEQMLKDTNYKSKAKELSYIYHNRLRAPGDELVFWVEHVVHTKGAPHLRSPAFTLPLYKRLYLDLIAVLVIILIAIATRLRNICQKSSTKKSKKEKKNS